MLKQRIITAVLMLLVLLPALFAQAPWPFALLTLVMIAAAGWEWFRLNGAPGVPALAGGVVVAAGSAAMWQIGWIGHSPGVLWQLALLLWVLGGAWVLRRGVAAWPQAPSLLRLAGGVLLLWLACSETLHGIARTVLVVPRIGKQRAIQLSALTGSVLAFVICWWLVPGLGLVTVQALLLLGVCLAGFMAAFDIAIGRWLMHK